MDAKPFIFALDCSVRSAPASLLRDLTTHVLGYAGCASDTIPPTVDALIAAVSDACDTSGSSALGLAYRSDTHRVDIIVSCGDREVYRTSRSIR